MWLCNVFHVFFLSQSPPLAWSRDQSSLIRVPRDLDPREYIELVGHVDVAYNPSPIADHAQVLWMEATQERVGATAKAIAGMSSIKLLGLSDGVFDLLQRLRDAELHSARHFRYIEVLTATISFMPLLLSPVFTFMVFVLQAQHSGSQLDTVSAFTLLTLLNLMTQPLVWLFQAVPHLMASLGCLRRVQSYLHAPQKALRLDVTGPEWRQEF